MKVKQVVGEHKKGVRAMKYNKKPVNPSHAHEKAKEKLQPIKPVEEAVLKAYDGKMATIDDPEHGKTINLDLTKPENAASLKPNDKGELEYDVTPDMTTPGAQPGAPTGPKPGTNVTIKTDETHQDIGGDPTDDFIDDVVDHDFEKKAAEGMFGFGNKSPEEWAKTSPQMAKLLQFRAKAKGTQYEAQVEQRIKLLKDRLDMDAGEVAGPGGVPKDPVPPEQFNMNQLRESDDELLERMRMIAGLR